MEQAINAQEYVQALRISKSLQELKEESDVIKYPMYAMTKFAEDYNVRNIQFDGHTYYFNPSDTVEMKDAEIKRLLEAQLDFFIDGVPFASLLSLGSTNLTLYHSQNQEFSEKWPSIEDVIDGKVNTAPWLTFVTLYKDETGMIAQVRGTKRSGGHNDKASNAIGEFYDTYYYKVVKGEMQRTRSNSKAALELAEKFKVILPDLYSKMFSHADQLKDILNLARLLGYEVKENLSNGWLGALKFTASLTKGQHDLWVGVEFVGRTLKEVSWKERSIYTVENDNTTKHNDIDSVLKNLENHIK